MADRWLQRVMDNKIEKEMVEVFAWSIPHFSKIKARRICSEPFQSHGYDWKLLVYLKEEETDGLSVYLDCCNPPDSEENACFDFSVILENKNDEKSIALASSHKFSKKDTNWGFGSFLPLDILEDIAQGFLVADILRLTVQFEVDKISSSTSLGETLWEFRRERISTDITIITSTGTLHAHKVVLMAASPVLKAMLTADMEESRTSCVEMNEFSLLAVEQFLEYAYVGHMRSEACKTLCVAHLWAMGDKYLVPGLVKCVEDKHKSHITLENVMGVFIDADKFKAKVVTDSCFALISKNRKLLRDKIEKLPDAIAAKMLRLWVDIEVA